MPEIKVEREYWENGVIMKEIWYSGSHIYRKNAPAVVEYYRNGRKEQEKWYEIPDRIHRENAPAVIEYHPNRVIAAKKWYKNGKLHREDGPAVIKYSTYGDFIYEEYYINGIRITKEELEKYKAVNNSLDKMNKAKKIKL